MTALGELADIDPPTPRPPGLDQVITIRDIDEVSATVMPRPLRRDGEGASFRRVALPGDIIFAQISPSMENGKVAIVPPLAAGAVLVSGELLVIRPRRAEHAAVVWAFLRRRALRRAFRELMVGTTRPRLPRAAVADVEIPAAAFECWPRAGEVLAHLDEAICLRRRSSAMLGRLPALVAAQAGLRKNGWTALDQVAEVTAGVTQSGSPFGETPMLRPGDLANGSVAVGVLSFVPDGATHVTALREGDILIVRRGSDGVRGRSAIYEGEPPAAAFNPNLAAIRCERLPAELLWAWLQTDEARTALDREARGTKAPVWSIAALKELLVPWFESSEVPARAAQVIRSLRLAMPVASSQQALIGSVVQAYLGRIFAGSVVAAARPDEQPSMTEAIPEALLGVFLRASPDQRQVWQRVAGTAGSFRVADLVESDRERAHLQHTLSLLEQLGIVISERDSLIDRWRVPDPDEDLIG